VLALLTAACDPSDRAYVREGIGTRLETPGIVDQTVTEDSYLAQLCAQGDCGGRNDYTTIVQAGMNDIDRRCDAYLTWLDARRRDKEPILNQIAAVGATTGAILTATSAGAVPLAIAGQAFGLASLTYSNWNSRLLLAVDHSTVQTIVYSRQTDFRNQIRNLRVLDRPQAIYLLRNYLRICLPITIETDINTSITLVQRGDAVAAKTNPVVKLARPAIIRDVRAPLVRVIPSGTSGEPTDPVLIASIRKALCLSESGSLDETTHKRLGIYLDSIKQPHSEKFFRREMILLDRLIRNNKTADCSLFG
jgi:hypothetical protein